MMYRSSPTPGDQRVDDRERQRQLQMKCSSDAHGRLNLHSPAQFLDMLSDHVHADSASRHIGYLRGGRKPGMKDEIEHFGIAEIRPCRREPALDRFVQDFCAVEPLAVVHYIDDDVPGLVAGL